jgi:hypothetical protein
MSFYQDGLFHILMLFHYFFLISIHNSVIDNQDTLINSVRIPSTLEELLSQHISWIDSILFPSSSPFITFASFSQLRKTLMNNLPFLIPNKSVELTTDSNDILLMKIEHEFSGATLEALYIYIQEHKIKVGISVFIFIFVLF